MKLQHNLLARTPRGIERSYRERGDSGQTMSTTPDSDSEGGGRPSNVLLLAPTMGEYEDRMCGQLLDEPVTDGAHTVLVACRESPDDRLDVRDEQVGPVHGETTVVDVEAVARSAAAATGGQSGGPTPDRSDVRIESVSDPTDLIDLGTTLDTCLRRPTGSCETVLCFHSLTDLLQYTDRREVFKFLEVLTGNVDRAGAVAHYHLDPSAHDEETIETIAALCDETLDARGPDAASQ